MIDKQGFLRIYRKNEYKLQLCPFSTIDSACGDWCPLFEEYKKCKLGLKDCWIINICNGKTLIFDEFIDERK
ncbi:MAG: hypothetical protein DRP29_09790 [Thermodesulfobacteriota bacterium]|nr:MAG: hypothetical protein DRP29_09790 [Thermodesulfobacteriota bacterium]